MATPTLDRFLGEVSSLLQTRNGPKLAEYLRINPPFAGTAYEGVIAELRQNYAAADSEAPSTTKKLEQKLKTKVPEYDLDKGTSGASQGFWTFLLAYLLFLRDVEMQDLATVFQRFRGVMAKLSPVLGDSVIGNEMHETAMIYSKLLVFFTRELEQKTDLISAFLTRLNSETEETVTLASLTVGSIRPIFEKCAPTQRTKLNTGLDEDGQPAGHRRGIYFLANLCFPLCLRLGSMESMEGMITHINLKSPPISHYPISQRVTYLYYLGRYLFAYSHFGRAQTVLDEAYRRIPARFPRQRAQILTYLMASNVILGRFPSLQLLHRTEAESLRPHFGALCKAIKQGNLPKFRSLLDLQSPDAADSATANFFFRRKILLQLRSRCEVLMYRSLFRRMFILTGFHGAVGIKSAPNFDLADVRTVVVGLEKRVVMQAPGHYHAAEDGIDPEFEGCEDEFWSMTNAERADATSTEEPDYDRPSLDEVEATAATLIYQGLLHGNISHRLAKIVITGARGKNPVEIGFPRVSDILRQVIDNGRVPGWVQDY